MKRQFLEKRFGSDRTETIRQANEIIETYQDAGYRLTLRQLYYQFVSRDLIPNTERSYKNLGCAINDGRLAGQIDWDAIEDRVRQPKIQSQWSNIPSLVESALLAYRLPRWEGQPFYLELWVEKDALAGVLQPLANEYHVTMMVNRGYSSQSAMYESANRFIEEQDNKTCHLLYLGDHDPSGEDMVRDIADRLKMFGAEVAVKKVALTMAQVRQYNPPPNPAKMTDSRANGYVAKHGNSSWEVDALPPDVLASLIRKGIEQHLKKDLMEAVKRKEEQDKNRLRSAAIKIK